MLLKFARRNFRGFIRIFALLAGVVALKIVLMCVFVDVHDMGARRFNARQIFLHFPPAFEKRARIYKVNVTESLTRTLGAASRAQDESKADFATLCSHYWHEVDRVEKDASERADRLKSAIQVEAMFQMDEGRNPELNAVMKKYVIYRKFGVATLKKKLDEAKYSKSIQLSEEDEALIRWGSWGSPPPALRELARPDTLEAFVTRISMWDWYASKIEARRRDHESYLDGVEALEKMIENRQRMVSVPFDKTVRWSLDSEPEPFFNGMAHSTSTYSESICWSYALCWRAALLAATPFLVFFGLIVFYWLVLATFHFVVLGVLLAAKWLRSGFATQVAASQYALENEDGQSATVRHETKEIGSSVQHDRAE